MNEQARKTIEDNKLIQKGDRVLVCVSGGPDSMALFHVMLDLRERYDIELVVAHLDHMLRGKQSAADAAFVKKIVSGFNLPFVAEKIDVKKIARESKMSIEEAAREARYDFYMRAAEDSKANKIATGHNMDDQAETVLMRLLRGSGSRGLSGIPYKRRLGNIFVIRPLLDIKREEIENYLKKRGLPSRTDASNLETFYIRNRIRHALIPLIEKEFNPRIKENLSFIAQNMSDETDYLDRTAKRLLCRLAVRTKTKIDINISDLSRSHIALRRLIVRQAICFLKGDLKKITYRHWLEIEAILSEKNKSGIDLPGGIKVKRQQGTLAFFKGRDTDKKHRPRLEKSIAMNIPGKVVIPELGVILESQITSSRPRFKKGRKKRRIEYVDGDMICAPLKIRTRRKGDRMRPLGMKSFKKLHDIFVDEKVPRFERDSIPLVISGNRILWAVGVKLSEDCRVRGCTQKIVRLTAVHVSQK